MTNMAATDEELMRLYLSGDSHAFDAIYKKYSGRVYSYLLKKLGRRQDADDIHQAVFLKFHNSRHSYDSQYAVLQWLFVIARTAVLDFYRRQKRALPIDDGISTKEIENIAEPLSQKDRSPSLNLGESLTEEQRQIVEWRYMDDLSFEVISQKLGKSEVNVRQILSRALKKLRTSLVGKGSET